MPKATCPNCGRTLEGSFSDQPYYPFCCKKCKLIDLGRWFDEDYGIAKEEPEGEDGQPAE